MGAAPVYRAAAQSSGLSGVGIITTSFWFGMLTAVMVGAGRVVAGYLDARQAAKVERQYMVWWLPHTGYSIGGVLLLAMCRQTLCCAALVFVPVWIHYVLCFHQHVPVHCVLLSLHRGGGPGAADGAVGHSDRVRPQRVGGRRPVGGRGGRRQQCGGGHECGDGTPSQGWNDPGLELNQRGQHTVALPTRGLYCHRADLIQRIARTQHKVAVR